jgi:Domain of unknown function (DUF932)
MPFDNLPYSELADRYGYIPASHAAPQLWGAESRKLFDEHGEEIPGYFRIARQDNGKTVHVHSDSYAFVDNRTAFAQFEDAIEASDLDADGMLVATDYSGANGERVFRQYLFPAHQVTVRPGVEVALRIIMLNSYDKSAAFTGRAGAYSFVCANTSIFGNDIGNFRIKHAGQIDSEAAVRGLVQAAGQHVTATQRMKIWPQIDLDDKVALALLGKLEGVSEAQVDRLVHSWVVAKDDDGPQGGTNMWALYSTLTAWATHGDESLGGMAGRMAGKGALGIKQRIDREKRVAQLVSSKAWIDVDGFTPKALLPA